MRSLLGALLLLLLPARSTTCPVGYSGPTSSVQEWRMNGNVYDADVGCDSGGLKQGRVLRFTPPLTGAYSFRVPTTCASIPIAIEVRQGSCSNSSSELALGCATGNLNVELNSLTLQAGQNYSLVMVANDSAGVWQGNYYDMVQVGVEGSFGPKLVSLIQPNLFEFSTRYGLSTYQNYVNGSPFVCEPGWYRIALMASFVPEVSGFYYVRVESFTVYGWNATGIMQIDESKCGPPTPVFCERGSSGKLGSYLVYLYAGREYTVTIGAVDQHVQGGSELAVGFLSTKGGGDAGDCLDFSTAALASTLQYQRAPLSLDHAYATEFACEVGAVTRPAQYVAFTPPTSGNYFVRIAPASDKYKGDAFLEVRVASCNGTSLGCATRVYSGAPNLAGKVGLGSLSLVSNTTYVFLAWTQIGKVVIEVGLVNSNVTCTDRAMEGAEYGFPMSLVPSSYAHLKMTCAARAYDDAGFYTTVNPPITGNYYVYVANSPSLFGIEVRTDSCQGGSVACSNFTSFDRAGLDQVYLQSGLRYVVLVYPLAASFQSTNATAAGTVQIGYCGSSCKTSGPTRSPLPPSTAPTKVPTKMPSTKKPTSTILSAEDMELTVLLSVFLPPAVFGIVLCAVMVMCQRDQTGGTISLIRIRRLALFCALMVFAVFTTGWAVVSSIANYALCAIILIWTVLLRRAAKTTEHFTTSYVFTKSKLIRNVLGLMSVLLLGFGALAFLKLLDKPCATCVGATISIVYAVVNGVACAVLAVSATTLGVLFHNAAQRARYEAVRETMMAPMYENVPMAQVVPDAPTALLSSSPPVLPSTPPPESIVCQRCQTVKANRTLHRCGHTLCASCATEVMRKGKQCPFCDSPIEDVMAHL